MVLCVRRPFVGIVIVLCVFAATLATSYALLNQFYGVRHFSTSTQMITIEKSGQLIITDNAQFNVANAELTVGSDNNNYYRLLVGSESQLKSDQAPPQRAPAPATGELGSKAPAVDFYYINVPANVYDQAVKTGGPVTFSNVTLTETEPLNILPIAASISIAVGLVAVAIWLGYRQSWGEATSTLLERGLHDMTVRDVEIVGYIMEKEKFTIPELMKLSNASKITVWRTVQKLVANGLVEETAGTKLAANGLGGRGKPSRIYRYVGKKGGRATDSPRS